MTFIVLKIHLANRKLCVKMDFVLGLYRIALVLAKFTFQESLQTVLQHKLNSLFADSYKLVPNRDLTVRWENPQFDLMRKSLDARIKELILLKGWNWKAIGWASYIANGGFFMGQGNFHPRDCSWPVEHYILQVFWYLSLQWTPNS